MKQEDNSSTWVTSKNLTNKTIPQSLKRSASTPAQEELKSKIQILESQLNTQLLMKNSNLSNVSKTDVDKTKKELESAKKSLKQKENNMRYQQKFLDSQKKKIETLCTNNNEAA